MPLQRSDTVLDLSDPNLVSGPRKRHPTEHVLENGDPLVYKKKKKDQDNVSTGTTVSIATDKGSHTLSSIPLPPPQPPMNQTHTMLNAGQSTNHAQSYGAQAIMVDDSDDEEESHGADENKGVTTDEDDDAELCMCSITLVYFYRLIHQLAQLQKEWDSPIYTFFKPLPTIEYIQGRRSHVFECGATKCGCWTHFVRRFLDTSDARSTSNLRHHAKICWSDEAVNAADSTQDIKATWATLDSLKTRNGSIMDAFQKVSQGKAVYNIQQFTKIEARYV